MSEKYYKPKDFSQQDWDNITNVIANPNSPETVQQASSFKNTKDIDKHVVKLELQANPNERAIGITGNTILRGLLPFRSAQAFLFDKDGFQDLYKIYDTQKLLKEYKTILKKKHNQLETTSIREIVQQLNNEDPIPMKELIQKLTNEKVTNSNINQKQEPTPTDNYNKPEKESQEALPQESQSIKDIIQKISNKAGKP